MSTTSSHLPSSRLAHHQEGRAVATGPAATPSVLAHAPAVLGTLLLHAALAAGALVMVLPFLWMLTTAVKPPAEVYLFPPRWLPSAPTLEHFARILQQGAFAGYFANSIVVATVQTVATVILGAMAGYAFARLQWPGRDGLFWLLVAKMMVPQIITLIPLFVLVKNLPLLGGNDLLGTGGSGLLDTYAGLLLPGLVNPLAIFLFRQFFLSLPAELEDAARVDGCSEIGIFWRIAMPLCTPAAIAAAIFTFERGWNAFDWPLVVTRTEAMRTIQIGLAHFRQEADTQWALLMAGSALAAIPVIVVFVLLQRHFVRGIAMSGLKG